MKLYRILIVCLLLAAGRFAAGQSFVVNWGGHTPCQPPTAGYKAVPTCFPVLSYYWGASQVTGTPIGGIGKPSVEDVSLLKTLDGATTALFLDMLTGKVTPDVLVAYYKNAVDAQALKPTYTLLLSEVIVDSEQASDAGANLGSQTESVSLVFEKMEISYYPQKADGSWGAPIQVTYNIAANRVS